MADLLSDEEVSERLGGLEGWEREKDRIAKTFEHGDFVGSVEFVRRLTAPAEGMGHHPDLEISWDKVKVSITNHSAGGLTGADFELAAKIDALD
jgi:4a-hydroxytetrahydrobiopterin dehydratase